MELESRAQSIATVAVLLIVLASIVAGSHALVLRSAHHALIADAEITAANHAERLGRLPGIREAMQGRRLPTRTERYIFGLSRDGLFRVRLFDNEGVLRFDSDLPTDAAGLRVEPGVVSESALSVLSTGKTVFDSETGDGVRRPLHYSEAYVPLAVNGEIVGVVEGYFDQSATIAKIEGAVRESAFTISALAGIAFALPALALLWSMRLTNRSKFALAHAASHDGMTGLLNRHAFRNSVEARIREFERYGGELRILFVDLDKFKEVNDTRGHAAGDELLRQVAARIVEEAGKDDVICRLGGDEFAIMEPCPQGVPASPTLARRTIAALSRPFRVGDDRLRIGASVGVAEYPKDALTTSDLLRSADLALYEAKEKGRGQHCHYAPAMEARRAERQEVDRCIRAAVDDGTFDVHYQPLRRTANATLIGYEALIRITDQEGNPIPPSLLIPIAEETEMIVPLGERILERVCAEAMSWERDDLIVSVNLSPIQFKSGRLPETVRRILAETGLRPERLSLEMTESVLLSDVDRVSLQLDALKELGVMLALDDFGTGYSSLSYLWRFPFDTLKIDRSFIDQLDSGDARSRRIMETMVTLGQVLELTVTAEGVETHNQDRRMRELQIDTVQGYFYGRPERVPEHLRAEGGEGSDQAAG